MFDSHERNIIRGYLDSGMSPDSIANYIGRLSDLEDADILLIRAAATEMLDEPIPPPPLWPVPPKLTLLQGGVAS
jgi:hypothetical protein